MTEKQFTYDTKQVAILKDGEFWLDGQVDTACNHSEICNELNALHEENQKLLTLSNMKKGALVEAVKDLIKENEQLKSEIETLHEQLAHLDLDEVILND